MPPSLATSQYPGALMGSMEMTRLAFVDRRLESVTTKVTGYWPEIVGVPLRSPFVARWMPGGNVPPPTAHEYGPSPPPAAREVAYVRPIVPTGRVVVVMLGGAERVAMIPPELVP